MAKNNGNFGTVISRPTGHFLIDSNGFTIVRANPHQPKKVYDEANRLRLTLVNNRSPVGLEILNKVSPTAAQKLGIVG